MKIVIIILIISFSFLLYGCNNDEKPVENLIEIHDDGVLRVYNIQDSSPQYGLVFYVGTIIAPKKYDKLMSLIASEGFLVVVPHMPSDIAMFNAYAMDTVLEYYPEVSFVLSGHSLGGLASNIYINDNPDKVAGLIYFASHPGVPPNHLRVELPCLSIIPSNDEIMEYDSMYNSPYYPKNTRRYVIEGGNHISFAKDFNFPDGRLEITQEEQIIQSAEESIKFLKEVFDLN